MPLFGTRYPLKAVIVCKGMRCDNGMRWPPRISSGLMHGFVAIFIVPRLCLGGATVFFPMKPSSHTRIRNDGGMHALIWCHGTTKISAKLLPNFFTLE